MAKSSLRAGDMIQERILANYLNEKYYNSANGFNRAERTDDLSNQMLGSEIIISNPTLGLIDDIVDEK